MKFLGQLILNGLLLCLFAWLAYQDLSLLMTNWASYSDKEEIATFIITNSVNVIWLCVALIFCFQALNYFRRRLKGESHDDIYPPQIEELDLIEVEKESLVFSKSAGYKPIQLTDIESIDCLPSDENWQEIRIKLKGYDALIYQLNNTREYFESKVKDIKSKL